MKKRLLNRISLSLILMLLVVNIAPGVIARAAETEFFNMPNALQQGGCAKVINSNGAGGLAVRVVPSTGGALLYRMPDNTKVRITGGSITFGGYTWWPHSGMQQSGQPGRISGWSAGDYLQETDCSGLPNYDAGTQLSAQYLRRDNQWVNGSSFSGGSEPVKYLDSTHGKPGQFPLSAPLTSSPSMRNKQLYEAVIGQFAVGDNPQARYAQDNYTYCNTFAGDVMRAMGVPLPIKSASDPATKGAADLYNWLIAGNGWLRIYPNSSSNDMTTLINHVNAGKPALAATPTHIAVIRPQAAPADWRDLHLAQAGAQNSNDILLRNAWTSEVPAFFIINESSNPPPPPSCPTITHWKGEYWNNKNLSGNPTLCRNDVDVNFNWGTGGPGGGIPNDNFSVRWTRTINFAAGTFRFHTKTDDGVRLWIDGVLVIDKWIDQGVTEYTVDRQLTAGNHTIKMEYYENGGSAYAQFWYEQIGGGGSCTPPANGVVLYEHSNYQGTCTILTGDSANLGSFSDKASSIKFFGSYASGYAALVYEHTNYGGASSMFTGNDSDFGNDTIGHDRASSIQIRRFGGPSGYTFCAWEGQRCNFSGVKNVAYGAQGSFYYKYATRDGIDCNNSVFGDPKPGVVKACYIKNATNLAYNRPATASSQENGNYPPYKGNDGNTGTRWSSQICAGCGREWWRVDLGTQTFDRVILRWENAYAKRYFVGWSNDGSNFTGYWYDITAPGVYTHDIGQRNARYVAVIMDVRAPGMGNFSFWETEVYRFANQPFVEEGEILLAPASELETIVLPGVDK